MSAGSVLDPPGPTSGWPRISAFLRRGAKSQSVRFAEVELRHGTAGNEPVAAPGATAQLNQTGRLYARIQDDFASRLRKRDLLIAALAIAAGYYWHEYDALRAGVPVRLFAVAERGDGELASREITTGFKAETKHVHAVLARCVRQLVTIDSYTTRAGLQDCQTHLRGKAVEELKDFIQRDGIFARMRSDPSLTRTPVAKSLSVDPASDGMVFVHITTIERRANGSSVTTGQPLRWRFAVQYANVPPDTPEAIFADPTGTFITHFAWQVVE